MALEPDGNGDDRRRRLTRLIDLARAYNGLTRKDLAAALGREPTSALVPPSGIPKLDVAIELARILDWPLEEVARYLFPPAPPGDGDGAGDGRRGERRATFARAQEASRVAQHHGRFAEAAAMAREAQAAAE